MSELRAGGLAIIVRQPKLSFTGIMKSNIGKCVTLIRMVSPGEGITTPNGDFLLNWTSTPAWYITGDIVGEFISGRVIHGYVIARKESLMPIDGEDFSHEDHRQKELNNG